MNFQAALPETTPSPRQMAEMTRFVNHGPRPRTPQVARSLATTLELPELNFLLREVGNQINHLMT